MLCGMQSTGKKWWQEEKICMVQAVMAIQCGWKRRKEWIFSVSLLLRQNTYSLNWARGAGLKRGTLFNGLFAFYTVRSLLSVIGRKWQQEWTWVPTPDSIRGDLYVGISPIILVSGSAAPLGSSDRVVGGCWAAGSCDGEALPPWWPGSFRGLWGSHHSHGASSSPQP